MIKFNHFNFNVLDLDKSLAFYKEALGLEPVREKEASDGSFKLVYLGDGLTEFQLELTWLKDRDKPYDLGECESTWLSSPTSTTTFMLSTRRWAASALKTRAWASTSLPTRTAIGSRSCRRRNKWPGESETPAGLAFS